MQGEILVFFWDLKIQISFCNVIRSISVLTNNVLHKLDKKSEKNIILLKCRVYIVHLFGKKMKYEDR